MIHQTVFDTSEVLRLQGLRQVVISPGSRNAPLTVSFARNKGLQCFSVIDERSAAFIALGMSLQSGLPTAACCTSGTALLNYAPAAAEAYYQEVPLILISADRPPEWINQRDGQTIQQLGALEPHVKASYQLPVDLSHDDAKWEYQRKLKEAVTLAQTHPKGPIHLNIPFREPFYPEAGQSLEFSDLEAIEDIQPQVQVISNNLGAFRDHYIATKKRIIVLGQGAPGSKAKTLLSELSMTYHTPVLSDVMANGYEIEGVITGQDLLLQNRHLWDDLRPDLVLTLGQSLISKQLKLFLRTGVEHWHISQGERTSDTFRSLRGSVQVPVEEALKEITTYGAGDANYFQAWTDADASSKATLEQGLSSAPFSDYVAMQHVMASLPASSEVHLANSMAVRYANFFQHLVGRDIRFHANRGTSGIDGSNSSAVGFAINSGSMNVLLTGDVSLLYDRNAFLHGHVPENLKVIVLNNFGGGIFDLIPGPRRLTDSERTSFLGTRHQRSMRALADQEGFSYFKADDVLSLTSELANLLAEKQRGILEIQTDAKTNQLAYDQVKSRFQKDE